MEIHTEEYKELEYVDEDSTLFVAGFLAEDEVTCRQTDGQYQYQLVDGQVVLMCTGHQQAE